MSTDPSEIESIEPAPELREHGKRSRWRTFARVLLGLIFVSAVSIAAILARGIPFPELTGPYPVGRTSYHLVDASRPEHFSANPDDLRELMIYVHYPADKSAKASLAPYADPILANGVAKAFDVPSFPLRLFHSHALNKPPCDKRDGGFPVIIFSPGLGMPPLLYTATLEEIASQGFAVVAVSHPYSVAVTAFPDGRIVAMSEAGSKTEQWQDDVGTPPAPPSDGTPQPSDVWVEDLRFVLNELTRLNHDDALLAGHMDLSKVGVFGHSYGGAASARILQIDDRFRAAINMDGTEFRATMESGIPRPMMWINAELQDVDDATLAAAGKTRAWAEAGKRIHEERIVALLRASPDGTRATVRGAAHLTLASDLALVGDTWPWSILVAGVDLGTISGRRSVQVVDTCVVRFFQNKLLGQSSPALNELPREFPELIWKVQP